MDTSSLDALLDYINPNPAFLDARTEMHFAKGEDIFRQGDLCPDIFIMARGLVKLHYVTYDGKEWIKSFITDRGILGSRASQSLGQPSTFSATCLEDTTVTPLLYKTFETQCSKDPELATKVFQFFQWLGLKKELREHDLLCLSAEQRYRNFQADQSALAARITQTDMARYLGITPIALSRIKGRLAQGS